MDNPLNHEERMQIKNRMRQYSAQLTHPNVHGPVLTKSSHPGAQFQQATSPALFLSGENRKSSDVRSLIEQLMKSKDVKIKNDHVPLSLQPLLVNTEEKIFSEVINILVQIQSLKEQINHQKQQTTKLQSQRDMLKRQKNLRSSKGKRMDDFDMQSIINKLKGKDSEELRLSVAEIQKFATENQYLQEKINRLKIKNQGNYEQIFQHERQRYEVLKAKLQEKKKQFMEEQTSNEREIIQEIQDLKSDIHRMKNQGDFDIGEEIRLINEENEKLRQKTIEILKSHKVEDNLQERKQLEQYIRREEQNKILFYDDLKKFKEEYNRLKQENESLKERAKSKPSSFIDAYSLNNIGTQNFDKNDDKFEKYKDLVYQMKDIMK